MGKLIDLTGQQFGRLTVIHLDSERMDQLKSENKTINAQWVCKCTCGKITTVSSNNLKGKHNSKSCGCLRVDNVQKRNKNNAQMYCEKAHELYGFKNTMITSLTSHLSKANKTGVKGVYYNAIRCKFVAQIILRRKKIHLGYFDKLEDAAAARAAAEEKYYKPILEEFKQKQMEE